MTEQAEVSRPQARVSAVVITFNEEANIAACLDSLDWCDEIIVVDSHSTDRTPEIAQSYDKVRFFQRPYWGAASQKNWAMKHAQFEWTLIFDADERCTPELTQEIQGILADPKAEEAYVIRRRVYFLGKVIRFSGWQNDRVTRLLKTGAGRYQNRRVHPRIVTSGDRPALFHAPILKHPMDHYMAQSMTEYVERIRKYSYWGGAQAWKDGKRAGFSSLVLRPFWRFMRTYIVQLGFLDGLRGITFCLLQAAGTYMKWAMVWGWGINERRGHPLDLPEFDEDKSVWGEQDPDADADVIRPAPRPESAQPEHPVSS